MQITEEVEVEWKKSVLPRIDDLSSENSIQFCLITEVVSHITCNSTDPFRSMICFATVSCTVYTFFPFIRNKWKRIFLCIASKYPIYWLLVLSRCYQRACYYFISHGEWLYNVPVVFSVTQVPESWSDTYRCQKSQSLSWTWTHLR